MRVNCVWLLVLCSAGLFAQEAPTDQPSMELLEFLGGFEAKDGKWIDPTQYLDNPDLAQVGKEDSDND